jgi:DNA-binding NtrC family response regulator
MNKKILLVDDDLELCNELADLIREEGYLVDNTSDSEEGAGLIKKNSYELCIFDYKMKGLTGIDLLKIVKGVNLQCTVLIVSGRPSLEKLLEEENAADLITGVISKPFDVDALMQQIKAIICTGKAC